MTKTKPTIDVDPADGVNGVGSTTLTPPRPKIGLAGVELDGSAVFRSPWFWMLLGVGTTVGVLYAFRRLKS
jgi:hypothetical protein